MTFSAGLHAPGIYATIDVTCVCGREYERDAIKEYTALQQARNVQRVCMRLNRHDEKGRMR